LLLTFFSIVFVGFSFDYNDGTPRWHQALTMTMDNTPLSSSPMSNCSWGGTRMTTQMPGPPTTDDANTDTIANQPHEPLLVGWNNNANANDDRQH
jgi:hypothetical protein